MVATLRRGHRRGPPLAAGLYGAARVPGAMVASIIFLAVTTIGTILFMLPGVYL
jgi:hypothetical protein